MAGPKEKGASPLSNLISRQIGDNIPSFRQTLFRGRLSKAKNLFKKDLVAHYGCVNAIEFSNDGDLLVSGGDDRRVLLWKLEQSIAGISEPVAMKNQHYSNIFCLAFNNDKTKIYSGGNDDAVIIHDVQTLEPYDVFLHSKPVYGLSVDATNDQIFSTAGEDGRILVFDLRTGSQAIAFPKSRAPYHAVMFHPLDGNYIITANGKDGAAFWDLRDYNKSVFRYGGANGAQSCMSVRFNTHGSQVLALRRRLPPILYNAFSQDSICQFYHPDYYNSCTMKSCCFAGENDELILSGSDDFNLYVWRTTDADCNKTNQWIDSYHMVLYGHRSIVNQVRYNPQRCLVASSGVEKIIKLWTPFESEGWKGSISEEAIGPDNPRDIFSHEEYVSLLNASGQNMTHDYSNQNTMEDPRMMAFFDSLVQREIEGWISNDSDSDKSSTHSSDESSRPTSTLQSESDSTTNVSQYGNYRRTRSMGKAHSRYINRIAYLIATKRNTLKRLALKGSPQTTRRVKSSKVTNRKLSRSSNKHCRKANNKRTTRLSTNKRTRSHDCNANNSDNDIPKKVPKRRMQQHLNTPPCRSSRRVSKIQTINFSANYESGDTSSEGETANNENPANVPSTSRCNNRLDNNSPDSIDGRNEGNQSGSNQSSAAFPIPSTSTGITGNGIPFRIAQTPDSDDDASPQNSPPISQSTNNLPGVVPIKTNGIHNTKPPYSSGVDDEHPDENRLYNRNGRRKRNHLLTNSYHYTNYSSHSSSRLSSTGSSDSDDASDSNDNSFFSNSLSKKRKLTLGNMLDRKNDCTEEQGNLVSNSLLTGRACEKTPIASRSRDLKDCELTPDSGIASAACSSTGSAGTAAAKHYQDGNNNNNSNNGGSSDKHSTHRSNSHSSSSKKLNKDEILTTSIKLFQQNVARIRRNFRNIGDASYSEDSD